MQYYPLCWPHHGRISPRERVRSRFNEVTFAHARAELSDAIDRKGGTDSVVSTNVKLARNGFPRTNAANPKDPGVCVWFRYKGRQCCVRCDLYRYVWENLLEAKCIIEIREAFTQPVSLANPKDPDVWMSCLRTKTRTRRSPRPVDVWFTYKDCNVLFDLYQYHSQNILEAKCYVELSPPFGKFETFTPPATLNHVEFVKLAKSVFRMVAD
jgi:hypothetical protein